jgi:hypothetical protein
MMPAFLPQAEKDHGRVKPGHEENSEPSMVEWSAEVMGAACGPKASLLPALR